MTPVILPSRDRVSTPETRPPDLLEAVILVLSVGVLTAAFLLPASAEALLRLYLPALALAFVLTRVHDAELPRKMEQDQYSPFLFSGDGEGVDELPQVIRERARGLATLDNATPTPAPVPVAVRWLVIEAFTRKLAERRGLDLADPLHREAIRGLLSKRAWELVRPPGADEVARPPGADEAAPPPGADQAAHRPGSAGPAPASPASAGAERRSLSLHHLDSILDDLEKL